MKNISLITSLILFAGMINSAMAEKNQVAFPEGYRNWHHVKSMLIQPGHALADPFQGIHHIYANHKGEKGYKDGKYEDGAILVFDLLNYVEKDKTIQESDRKLIGVMQKDAAKYASTGGWGFEGFTGDSKSERLVKDGGKSCYDCHATEKGTDFVFSKNRQ